MTILNLHAARKSIKIIAQKYGVSEREMRKSMQAILDDAWAQDDATPEKQKLLQIFPNGKPCLEHFILGLAETLGPLI